ncbi:hypothetical protein [Heyndrickxia oleronia]|jgi:hypothetical protein|uniref:hypothetical protein n=1 Tax=Heyndrickxia oleronia TaxID=38875 RepID=UPI00242FE564|nr:hypothetical protein [Heyndrickxia oleronia]MCI1611373.1 hypothetical protein [Heyndrickxia oleronia]MCI1742816.1 hypothetical protein [Heyndrickxia oleronia]MCI1759893.1 hypothetical protein [Heyndrickxia oleronia]
MSSSWNKKEEKILIENFGSAVWEDFLEMLPNKSERQIFNRAEKLGIKREPETLEPYYDEEKEAWIDTVIIYNGFRGTAKGIIPAPKGVSFEEAKARISENVTKLFLEKIVKPRYFEILDCIGLDHDQKLFEIIYELEKELFHINLEEDRTRIFDKYKNKIEESLLEAWERQRANAE